MSRILKISQADYRVQVQSGGNITLDTGLNAGTVVITGNLDVQGTYSTVESTNTTIADNILQLNYGQTGSGISGALNYSAGIQVGRGVLSAAEFAFDERITHYNQISATDVAGTFAVRTADGVLSGLQLTTITIDGNTDLNFDLKNQPKVLKLANVDPMAYANLLLQASPERNYAIPNKLFVTTYVQAGAMTPGVADVDSIYKNDGPGLERTKVQAGLYNIDFSILSNLRAQINAAGMKIDNININGDTISNTLGTMVLTAVTNLITVNSVIGLANQSSTPSYISGQNKLYSSTVGAGKSGVFFTNNTNADELIAKNRALLFSMLF